MSSKKIKTKKEDANDSVLVGMLEEYMEKDDKKLILNAFINSAC